MDTTETAIIRRRTLRLRFDAAEARSGRAGFGDTYVMGTAVLRTLRLRFDAAEARSGRAGFGDAHDMGTSVLRTLRLRFDAAEARSGRAGFGDAYDICAGVPSKYRLLVDTVLRPFDPSTAARNGCAALRVSGCVELCRAQGERACRAQLPSARAGFGTVGKVCTLVRRVGEATAATIVLLGLFCSSGPAAAQAARTGTDVLSERCVSCHNPQKLAGGIDLTTRAAALRTNALAAGKPAAARILRVVSSGKMPPAGKLAGDDLSALSRWASAGSPYPSAALTPVNPAMRPLWSFAPVRKPEAPSTILDKLAVNPVDRFVYQKLIAAGLKPSPPANRRALIRRVTLDLTGLPPTLVEIQAFVGDRAPNAYGRLVDRLLASSAYGERWARHWLDVVRFGESHGYEQNHIRPNAWPYRDYVIRALNDDTPYDRFMAEQIAGDVLGSKNDMLVQAATGFLVAGVHDTVGIQEEIGTRQQRANDLDDMAATTGAAFLGLTVGCARCHDHKFDPIKQKDYYRLAAVFAGVRHSDRPIKQKEQSEKDLADQAALRGVLDDLNAQTAAIDESVRETLLKNNGLSSVKRVPVSARYNVETFVPVRAKWVRLTILATTDGSQPAMDELRVYSPDSPKNLALAAAGGKATASSLLPGYDIHKIGHLNDGKYGNDFSWISNVPGTGWAEIELPSLQSINRVAWSRDGGTAPRFDDRVPLRYQVEVSADHASWTTVATESGRAERRTDIPFAEVLSAMPAEKQKQRAALQTEIQETQKRLVSLSSAMMAYAGQFTVADDVYLLTRGDVMLRTEKVAPGSLSTLAVLNSDFGSETTPEAQRRQALAKWLGDPRNPLTPRVLVNRVWQHHFGHGIVGTPSDFGRNGEPPSHPALLDWLASVFVEQPSAERPFACGMQLKKLHKLMLMSATYRQASSPNAVALKVDAGNRMLWRMPLRRMEGEAIRDSILQTSGKLDRTAGGPGYKLYRYDVLNVAIYNRLEEFGPETWRRGIYSQAARGIQDELLSAFDCPESSQRAPKRDSTTTALQALSLLNGPFIVQQSEFMAERVRSQCGASQSAQVRGAFELAFGRSPFAAEATIASALIAESGLASLCRALLNANEFLYY